MKNVKIIISKTEIFEKVSLASAYTGVKTDGGEGFYDRVATIDADIELLSDFWTETCGIVTEKLREFIQSIESDDSGMTLNLELSNAYEDTLSLSVKEDIFTAFVSSICGRWFRVTFPDKAAERLSQSSELLNRAFSKLCHRKKPVRARNEQDY